jgi:hypothetical protein
MHLLIYSRFRSAIGSKVSSVSRPQRSAAMSLLRGATKLVQDRAVRVQDIMDCVTKFLSIRASRDLQSLLRDAIISTTWKTAPVGRILSQYHDFFILLFSICPNSILLRDKGVAALEAIEKEGPPIKFVARDTRDWCHAMWETIRQVASKYRCLVAGPQAAANRSKAFRKVIKHP